MCSLPDQGSTLTCLGIIRRVGEGLAGARGCGSAGLRVNTGPSEGVARSLFTGEENGDQVKSWTGRDSLPAQNTNVASDGRTSETKGRREW